MSTPRPRTLLVTPGDPDGIGPEITLAACARYRRENPGVRLLAIGAWHPFEELGGATPANEPRNSDGPLLPLLAAPTAVVGKIPLFRRPRGKVNLAGFQSGWSIVKAVSLLKAGAADALVTGPISKERLQQGGFPFPGHTEFLAALCRKRDVTMMLANDQLRVTLVTTHVALKDVSRHLNRAALRRAVEHTLEFLARDLGRAQPRIAIAALNPHAGESGLFGKEEQRVIAPELQALRRKHPHAVLVGPLPADTLFAKHHLAGPAEKFDAVVCMYHDQGLIPVKLLDFPHTVNVSLGLPIVRTSVDHGVGFDIARKGVADPSSLLAALRMAARIVDQRNPK